MGKLIGIDLGTDDDARDRALTADALAFLTKPFDADVLLGAVSVALRPR
jgi:DNA-binding response OmpR family regulator